MQNSRSIIFDTAVGTDVDGIDLEVSATISGGDIIKDGAGTVSLTNSANNLGTQMVEALESPTRSPSTPARLRSAARVGW